MVRLFAAFRSHFLCIISKQSWNPLCCKLGQNECSFKIISTDPTRMSRSRAISQTLVRRLFNTMSSTLWLILEVTLATNGFNITSSSSNWRPLLKLAIYFLLYNGADSSYASFLSSLISCGWLPSSSRNLITAPNFKIFA